MPKTEFVAAAAAAVMMLAFAAGDGAHAQSSGGASGAAGAVSADGSSTVYPITREAASRFARRHRDTPVNVAFAGTTAGFAKFCAGETDISNASRPMNREEMVACAGNDIAYIELPIALDALTIVVHPDNDWVDHITLEELRRLWEPAADGVITRWSQVRPGWPGRPIALFGRGQDSGTYDYFTSAVIGQVRSSRLDYTASEDVDFLVEAIAAEPEALGFFGVGAFMTNYEILRDVAVDSGQGPVYPNVRAVQAGLYRPLTRPLFIYVNAEAARTPAVASFVEFYLTDVTRWIAFTGYMPLSDEAYRLALSNFRAGRTGTAFGGEMRYDITVDEILRRQIVEAQ